MNVEQMLFRYFVNNNNNNTRFKKFPYKMMINGGWNNKYFKYMEKPLKSNLLS